MATVPATYLVARQFGYKPESFVTSERMGRIKEGVPQCALAGAAASELTTPVNQVFSTRTA